MGAAGWVATTISTLTLLSLIGAALRWLFLRVLHPLTLVLQDLRGEAARPGVPARPGVMERLMAIEDRLSVVSTLEARLSKVERRLVSIEARVGGDPRPRMEAGGISQVERADPGRGEDVRFGFGLCSRKLPR